MRIDIEPRHIFTTLIPVALLVQPGAAPGAVPDAARCQTRRSTWRYPRRTRRASRPTPAGRGATRAPWPCATDMQGRRVHFKRSYPLSLLVLVRPSYPRCEWKGSIKTPYLLLRWFSSIFEGTTTEHACIQVGHHSTYNIQIIHTTARAANRTVPLPGKSTIAHRRPCAYLRPSGCWASLFAAAA